MPDINISLIDRRIAPLQHSVYDIPMPMLKANLVDQTIIIYLLRVVDNCSPVNKNSSQSIIQYCDHKLFRVFCWFYCWFFSPFPGNIIMLIGAVRSFFMLYIFFCSAQHLPNPLYHQPKILSMLH